MFINLCMFDFIKAFDAINNPQLTHRIGQLEGVGEGAF